MTTLTSSGTSLLTSSSSYFIHRKHYVVTKCRHGEAANEEVSLTEVQAAREREFLELVCAPLDGFPADVATGIVDELADQLRAKVNDIVGIASSNL